MMCQLADSVVVSAAGAAVSVVVGAVWASVVAGADGAVSAGAVSDGAVSDGADMASDVTHTYIETHAIYACTSLASSLSSRVVFVC